jgi:UDP-N-acetylmuramyl pentapeptide phosphotransferase/UDP-N-acetylglucosamine-1-phosphate transferase
MIIQFICNFLLAIFLLNLYLTKINHPNLLDKNILGYGSKKETKTGSGIVFSIILLINYTYYLFDQSLSELYPNKYYVFLIAIFILTIISFIDDLYSLDPIFRLICQLIIIYFSTTLINSYYFVIPIKIILFIYVIFWVYIINVTNFIDGSDGYLTVNAISFLLGIVIINQFLPNTYFSYWLAIILLPILLAFIYFNKPKAKLYMGDTGSVLIGYILGFCLLELITSKYWYLSIVLYAYPVLDCSLVTFNKIYSGKSIFNRNFSYFFQLPIKKIKKNNSKVLTISIIYNLMNLLIVFFILQTENKYLILLSVILSIIKIQIFRKI